MVRLAMIGTGWQGQGHLGNLRQIAGIEVVGVCDTNEELLAKSSAKFGVPGFRDAERMLDEAKPAGLIVCTPPEVRTEPVRLAAQRGIALFIEKPPARTMAMAEEVLGIIEAGGVTNSVGFMYRYSTAVDRMREMLRGRRVAIVRSTMLDGLALRPNWPRWFFDKSRSGGALFDQAVHMIDLSRYLMGEVAAFCGFQGNLTVPKSGDFTVEDSFSLAWRYESGVLHNHAHSWAYPGFVCQFEFISDELHVMLDVGKGTITGQIGGENVAYQSEDALYRLELEAFAAAIREERSDRIRSTYADSMRSLAASLAALHAVETGVVAAV